MSKIITERAIQFFVRAAIAFIVFGFCYLFTPLVASATTYNYECGDMTGGTCSADRWYDAAPFSALDNSGLRPLSAGTWYFNGVVEGSGTPFRLTCYEYSSATCSSYASLTAGTYVDEPFTIDSGSSVGVYFWGQSTTDPAVSEICITDEPGGCDGGGEEEGGGASTTPSIFDELFGSATSSASSTISIVFDPNRDMANLLLLFTAWFFGAYWIFSKKR